MTEPNLLTAFRRTALAMQVVDEITTDEQALINAGFMPARVARVVYDG